MLSIKVRVLVPQLGYGLLAQDFEPVNRFKISLCAILRMALEKLCHGCGMVKLDSDFNKSASKVDGLQTRCRICCNKYSKEHYTSNVDYYKVKNKNHKKSLKEFVIKYKEGKPCSDCGGNYPSYVMDFDHRDPTSKLGSVSILCVSGRSLEWVISEIEKCDLICANCHRIRTFNSRLKGFSSVKSTKRFR